MLLFRAFLLIGYEEDSMSIVQGTGTATLEIQGYEPSMRQEVGNLLGIGFIENPIQVAAMGNQPLAAHQTFYKDMLGLLGGTAIVAIQDDRIIGFSHWARSPCCLPSGKQKMQMMIGMIRNVGFRTTFRALGWLGAWDKQHPKDLHWHLGPIVVAKEARGMGVGSLMMERYCQAMDAVSEAGYLETDKPENVAFYEKFGFRTISEAPVLGVTNYFMWRDALVGPPAGPIPAGGDS
jgi:ribosomal protein S18 acetylase RimI-like enzyme